MSDDRPIHRTRSVTVLGCDGSYPGPGGAASGYLVRAGGATLLLDAGPGTCARLQETCDPFTLDAVVLSHEHPDHWSDLDSLAVLLRRRDGARRVPVLAPPGLRRRAYHDHDRLLAWEEVGPSYRRHVPAAGGGPGVLLSFVATDHGPPTLAVRVEEAGTQAGPGGGGADSHPAARPGALAYSADTGPDWSVEELGPEVALFLCEATYLRDAEGSFRHLSGRQAGAMAAAAGVERLVVTHRWPTVSPVALLREAGAAFGRPAEQAAPGRRFTW